MLLYHLYYQDHSLNRLQHYQQKMKLNLNHFVVIQGFLSNFSTFHLSCKGSVLLFANITIRKLLINLFLNAFKVVSLSLLFSIAFVSSSCFCCNKITLVGSSFKSLFICDNSEFKDLLLLFILDKAEFRPVASPLISTVIPFILPDI